MRISKEEAGFLKNKIHTVLPASKIYLFGSRVDDDKKGGDIDILVISANKLTLKMKLEITRSFKNRFGEQKIDIVSYGIHEKSAFKDYILNQAIEL
ncbi:MAG: nucleotidyltransferase domain-containing protein [Spirochaetales bacterium]|nr:nucleotidyltransferase domain-containing protein [Spirochaetales bacterium]